MQGKETPCKKDKESYEYIGHSIYEEGNMVDKQDGDDMTGNKQLCLRRVRGGPGVPLRTPVLSSPACIVSFMCSPT